MDAADCIKAELLVLAVAQGLVDPAKLCTGKARDNITVGRDRPLLPACLTVLSFQQLSPYVATSRAICTVRKVLHPVFNSLPKDVLRSPI